MTSLFIAGTAFQTVNQPVKAELKKGNIEFKITNDLGSEFKYCVNGGHNYISSGSVKSFSYPDGQEFKYIDGGNCGKTWFKASSSMHGKSYKLSE
jgi:hypothetical protein